MRIKTSANSRAIAARIAHTGTSAAFTRPAPSNDDRFTAPIDEASTALWELHAAPRTRPARVTVLPRHDADRRLHHAGVSDRPDPLSTPQPRRDRGPPRRAESPLDPGAVGPRRQARRAERRWPTARPEHCPHAAKTRGDDWRARWAHRGVTSVAASGGPHRDRAAEGPRAAPAGRMSLATCPSGLAPLAIANYARSTPIDIPIPIDPQAKDVRSMQRRDPFAAQRTSWPRSH